MSEEKKDPLIGVTIGGCKLVSKLGAGGMGAVYRAVQVNLNAPVALKVMATAFAQDEGAIQMFEREAREVAKLRAQSPNVVQIYDFGLDKEHEVYYISMELVEGEGLNSLLKRAGKLPEIDAARITRQCAAGLEQARKHDIVHRDIKPDNVLVAKSGVIKITDFGLAKSVSSTGLSITQGRLLGTPAYMSPEQADAGEVDHRTDLYSLGATLYTMLTGQLPFKADTPVAMAMQHIRAPIPDPRDLVPDVSPGMATLVQALMSKEPDDRPQTAGQVVSMLDAIIRGEGDQIHDGEGALSQNTLNMVVTGGGGRGVDSEFYIEDEIPDSVRMTPSPAGMTQPTISKDEVDEGRKPQLPKKEFPVVPAAIGGVVLLLLIVAIWGLSSGGDPETGPGDDGTKPPPAVAVKLAMSSPAADTILQPGRLEVTGKASGPSDTWVLVNGRPVPIAGGRFSQEIDVDENTAEIVVEAGKGSGEAEDTQKIPVVVDGTAPVITIESPAKDAVTQAGTVTVTGTVTDRTAVNVTVNATEVTLTDGRFEYQLTIEEGEHTITVEARDAADNAAVAKQTVIRDTTAPEVTLFTPSGQERVGLPATLEVTGSTEPGATVTRDAKPLTVASDGSFKFTVRLEPGDNRSDITATDAAGNAAETVFTVRWRRYPEGLTASEEAGVAIWAVDNSEMVEASDGAGGTVYVDRDEVTVARYQRFLDAIAGSDTPTQWDHPEQPAHKKSHRPRYWSKFFRQDDSRPVVGVDWWDAYAYANWAGKRLPTEKEWVAAAGGDAQRFPWGASEPTAEHATFGVTGARAIARPVGSAAKGVAACGARDMVGNVWEWTVSGRPGEPQAVRGGGWANSGDELQISARVVQRADDRSQTVGFRCAWAPKR